MNSSRSLKRLLLAAVALVALPVSAFAQTSRVEAIHVQGDYIKDYTGIFTYTSGITNVGSLAYGVEELHIPLLIVLGHQHCGAVGAAVEFARTHSPLSPHVMKIVDEIGPAVPTSELGRADCVERAVAANVHRVCGQLATDAELAPIVRANQLRIVGARFVLDTGKVEFYL